MVKLLRFLFAFYILLLPCLPCADTGEGNHDSGIKISGLSTGDKEQQHEEDTCNPFCSCACCGQSFTPNFQLEKIAVIKPVSDQKKQLVHNNISLSSSFCGAIWQPPKFS
jgi:hypothetical protein